ncbi:ABC-three component system middle component 6 [Arsenicicoccus bolidensis]|uniref:ABC-three component system middle component 6 n=1 Tax=Arsenicicoccus bolidensis TaxID=229480 RepID=UPI0004925A0D
MILPTKYVPASDSVLGRAADLLPLRYSNSTVSELWYSYRGANLEVSFDSFTEALTLLFLIGVVSIDAGVLKWQV